MTGGHEGYGPQPADEHDLYRPRERALEAGQAEDARFAALPAGEQQEATWEDVQAAHTASWDAVEKSGLGSPESVQAFDLGAATHRNQIRHEARQATGREAEAGSSRTYCGPLPGVTVPSRSREAEPEAGQ